MSAVRNAALIAAMLAALASPAVAQQPGQPGAMMEPGMKHCPGMTGPGTMGHGPGMGPMMGGPGQHVEGRIAFLKAKLKITPEQEKLWNAYADAMRQESASMRAMHEQGMADGRPATLPERMQWHQHLMAGRLEALKTLQAAAVPLYTALSPEQKTIADDLIGMM
jgi:hypothetical protein